MGQDPQVNLPYEEGAYFQDGLTPILDALPIPSVSIFYPPRTHAGINTAWASLLIGWLYPLVNPLRWQGDENQQLEASQAIEAALLLFSEGDKTLLVDDLGHLMIDDLGNLLGSDPCQ